MLLQSQPTGSGTSSSDCRVSPFWSHREPQPVRSRQRLPHRRCHHHFQCHRPRGSHSLLLLRLLLPRSLPQRHRGSQSLLHRQFLPLRRHRGPRSLALGRYLQCLLPLPHRHRVIHHDPVPHGFPAEIRIHRVVLQYFHRDQRFHGLSHHRFPVPRTRVLVSRQCPPQQRHRQSF